MTNEPVYSDDNCHCLYAKSVTRIFGVNKIVTLDNGNQFLASVQPLNQDYSLEILGLKQVGTIEVSHE